jgi:hypothetical protein
MLRCGVGLLLVVNAIALEPGYTDPATCRPCHQAIFDSYRQTGMGRSFTPVGSVPPLDGFLHEPSGLRYSVVPRNGSSFLRRSTPPMERQIDYAIGSGSHSKTFVNRTSAGKLTELPVSWYSESGGYWNMSPGYDRPDHSDFRREVSDSCLFCHNGYPSQANGGLAHGIDCQRCHGPGESHAARKGSVVNPAKLSKARGLEVCLQCHLESASRTLPDAIRRFGRTVFSYRPGEALSDFMLYFQYEQTVADERITVNGAGYGLLKSTCFLRSGAQLTCTTCHDPHRQVTQAEADLHYVQVCRSCHPSSHEAARRDCTGCHMQKRRTEDAVHVVMTDHRIRRPLAGDLLAPLPERHDRLEGKIELLYPRELPASPETALYLAMAQGEADALARAISRAKPATADPYFELAMALQKAGRVPEAILEFRKLIQRFPAEARAYVAISRLMMEPAQADEAIVLLEQAVARLPDHPEVLNSLAVLYAGKQRFQDALRLLSHAVQVEPEDPVSWLNLGVCLEARGDRAGASAAYERTLELDPTSARAGAFLRRVAAPKTRP